MIIIIIVGCVGGEKLDYYGTAPDLLFRKNYQNVVSLMPHITDHLLSLEVEIAGVCLNEANHEDLYLNELLNDISNLGDPKLPDLEKLSRIKPDLIIGEAQKHLSIKGDLEKIAPTILIKDLSTDWVIILSFLAKVFNKEKIAKTKLISLQNKAAITSNEVKGLNEYGPILFFNHWKENQLKLYGDTSHLGKLVYQGLKMKAPYLNIENCPNDKMLYSVPLELVLDRTEDIIVLLGKGPKSVCKRIKEKGIRVFELEHLKDGRDGRSLIFYEKFLNDFSKKLQVEG